MIHLDKVTYAYPSLQPGSVQALKDVSLNISRNELVAVVGAAGSGKTTLMQHMNGLLTPDSGAVRIDGELLDTPAACQTAMARVGLVFQFPEAQFFEETVAREVAFGPGNKGWSKDKVKESVEASLRAVGLEPEHYLHRSPFQLSGGEKRRVAIASTLAMRPEVLILDEPTVGLDRRSGRAVEAILQAHYDAGNTVVFVTHDMDFVARVAKRVLVMQNGQLIYDAAPDRLFQNQAVLESAGLELPVVCRVLDSHRGKGENVPEACLTLSALAAYLNLPADGSF